MDPLLQTGCEMALPSSTALEASVAVPNDALTGPQFPQEKLPDEFVARRHVHDEE